MEVGRIFQVRQISHDTGPPDIMRDVEIRRSCDSLDKKRRPVFGPIHLKNNANHVSVCSSLAAILNAKFLLAAITHVCRITVSYLSVDCSVRHSSATIVCRKLQWSLWEIFLSATGRRCSLDICSTVGAP